MRAASLVAPRDAPTKTADRFLNESAERPHKAHSGGHIAAAIGGRMEGQEPIETVVA